MISLSWESREEEPDGWESRKITCARERRMLGHIIWQNMQPEVWRVLQRNCILTPSSRHLRWLQLHRKPFLGTNSDGFVTPSLAERHLLSRGTLIRIQRANLHLNKSVWSGHDNPLDPADTAIAWGNWRPSKSRRCAITATLRDGWLGREVESPEPD